MADLPFFIHLFHPITVNVQEAPVEQVYSRLKELLAALAVLNPHTTPGLDNVLREIRKAREFIKSRIADLGGLSLTDFADLVRDTSTKPVSPTPSATSTEIARLQETIKVLKEHVRLEKEKYDKNLAALQRHFEARLAAIAQASTGALNSLKDQHERDKLALEQSHQAELQKLTEEKDKVIREQKVMITEHEAEIVRLKANVEQTEQDLRTSQQEVAAKQQEIDARQKQIDEKTRLFEDQKRRMEELQNEQGHARGPDWVKFNTEQDKLKEAMRGENSRIIEITNQQSIEARRLKELQQSLDEQEQQLDAARTLYKNEVELLQKEKADHAQNVAQFEIEKADHAQKYRQDVINATKHYEGEERLLQERSTVVLQQQIANLDDHNRNVIDAQRLQNEKDAAQNDINMFLASLNSREGNITQGEVELRDKILAFENHMRNEWHRMSKDNIAYWRNVWNNMWAELRRRNQQQITGRLGIENGQEPNLIGNVQGQGLIENGQGQGLIENGQGQGLIENGQGQGLIENGQGQGLIENGQGQDLIENGQMSSSDDVDMSVGSPPVLQIDPPRPPLIIEPAPPNDDVDMDDDMSPVRQIAGPPPRLLIEPAPSDDVVMQDDFDFSVVAHAMRYCTRQPLSNIPFNHLFLSEVQKIFQTAFPSVDVSSIAAENEGNAAEFLVDVYNFIRSEPSTMTTETIQEISSSIAMTILVQCMMGRKHTPPSDPGVVPTNFMRHLPDITVGDQRGNVPSDEVLAWYIWNEVLTASEPIVSVRQVRMRTPKGIDNAYDNKATQAALPILEQARQVWGRVRNLSVNGGKRLEFYNYNAAGDAYMMEALQPNISWEAWYLAAYATEDIVKRTKLALLILGALYVYLPNPDRLWILRALAVAPHMIYADGRSTDSKLQYLVNPYISGNDYPYAK